MTASGPRVQPALPRGVAQAFLALGEGLDAHGDHVPCRRDPEAWFAPDAEGREAAAWRCGPCPVLALCATYAEAAGERWGVWAGVDRQRGPGAQEGS